MFKCPENLDECGWHPKYYDSPEMYADEKQFPQEHKWFEYYGHEYEKRNPESLA